MADLRNAAATLNNTTITLAPGDYWIDGNHIANPTSSEPIFLDLGGTNNTYNLAGANIKLDTRKLDGFGRALGHSSGVRVVQISGSDNTVNDLSLTGYDVDLATAPNAQRHADWAAVYVEMSGNDNTMNGTYVLTRGSSPYGLGDAFGKGARSFPQGEPASEGGYPWIGHNKTSAFLVSDANGAVIDDMHLDVRTYGHGFFVQTSDDTTLTNSTVTGVLFPSSNVSTHPKYIEYGGITKDGNPIPDGIFISGAEDGVRMYTGASNLTVDNVVVTNMRSGFAVALGSGNMNLNNVETYGAEHGFDFKSNTTITNAKGDITNGPLIWNPYTNTANSSIDVELVGAAPVGHDWAAAFISGNNVDVNISSTLPAGALGENALIRFGQRWWNDWRDHDNLDNFDQDAFDYINSSFTNNTNQILVLGNDVTGNTGSSQAPVITNGKDNDYDGISLVPTGKRTVVVHVDGLGNNGTAGDGSLESNASIVEDGGTLEVQAGIQITDEKLTITGDGVDDRGALFSNGQTGSGTRFGSSNSSDESTIFLDGNASIGVGIAGNQMLVGRIQGTGDLTKFGAGILSMEKSNTFAGNLIVDEGHIKARPGVVHSGLTVAAGASISGIGNYTFNTADGDVFLDGTLDLNSRTDSSSLPGKIGRLHGAGALLSSNAFAGSGGILEIAGDFGEAEFAGEISTNISLIKSGDSYQWLSGTLTHSGTTTVNGGGLYVNGTHTGGGAYFVDATGTLGGNGMIDATVEIGAAGNLAPGSLATLADNTGTLFATAVMFTDESQMTIEIASATDFDKLILSGSMAVESGAVLELVLLDGFAPAVGTQFDIVAFTSLVGGFDTFSAPVLPQGQWDFSQLNSDGIVKVVGGPVVLGDCNLDGVVDFLDISPFIAILTTGPYLEEADCNQDGGINFLDIAPFIAILSGN